MSLVALVFSTANCEDIRDVLNVYTSATAKASSQLALFAFVYNRRNGEIFET
jgi:hypothetical protein